MIIQCPELKKAVFDDPEGLYTLETSRRIIHFTHVRALYDFLKERDHTFHDSYFDELLEQAAESEGQYFTLHPEYSKSGERELFTFMRNTFKNWDTDEWEMYIDF